MITTWLSDRLVELSLAVPLIDPPFDRTTVRVLLPASRARTGTRYPVLLLLHGMGDSSRSWTTNQDGWPVTLEAFLGAPAWERYHLGDLLEVVDRTFPTRSDRGGRVVAGLSMGGFGAMSYAARHPDTFAGAFSFSGALDTGMLGRIFDHRIWGDRNEHELRHRGHNPVDLADNLADTRVWFRTGRGLHPGGGPKDGGTLDLEAYLWPTNESFAAALRAAGISHHYEDYPGGGHNWYHWQDGLQRAWPEIQALFDRPARAPRSFRYRSTEPRFPIWGWEVSVERPAPGLLRLREVSVHGLTLEGTGVVTLVTPPAYEPGQSFDLAVAGRGTSVEVPTARATHDGRLRLAVALGVGGIAQVRMQRRP